MQCCAQHVPGCEGGGYQPQKQECTVLLEGGWQHCEYRHYAPHNGPSPALDMQQHFAKHSCQCEAAGLLGVKWCFIECTS